MELKCKGCTERKINCHSTCSSYLEWKKENDELNEFIRKKKCQEFNTILDRHSKKRNKNG